MKDFVTEEYMKHLPKVIAIAIGIIFFILIIGNILIMIDGMQKQYLQKEKIKKEELEDKMTEYVTRCDRCGKDLKSESEDVTKQGRYYKWRFESYEPRSYFDLCEDCEQEFSKFLEAWMNEKPIKRFISE